MSLSSHDFAPRFWHLVGSTAISFLLGLFLASPLLAQPIRIGAIASLTGPAGEQGQNWLRGAQLAVEELNRSGPRATLLVEDDHTQAAQAVSAFQKLAQTDKVAGVLGGTWDFLGEALYPLSARAKIPFITPTNPPEVLSLAAQQNPWIFTTAMSLREVEAATRKFLVHQKVKRLAILVPSLPFGTVQADLLERLARELSIQVTQRVEFSPEGNYQDSVRNAALRFRQQRPDLIFAVVDYAILGMLTEELERIRFMPTILTTQHLDAALALSKTPKQFRNCYAVYPTSMQDLAFRDAFRNKFGQEPRVYAAEGYAATRFLIEAIESGVNFERPAAQFKRDSVLGPLILPPQYLRALSEGSATIMTTRSGRFEEFRFSP